MPREFLRPWMSVIVVFSLSTGLWCAQSSRTDEPGSHPPINATKKTVGSFTELAKRAEAARISEHTDEAMHLYMQALRLRPSWDEGWWYLGTLYYNADRYAEALPALRNLVQLKPRMGPAWVLLGLCEFEIRDSKNSLIHLERSRALGLGGNEELANVTRYHVALLLNLQGDFEAATKLLSSLAARGSPSPNVKFALGLALLRVPLLPSQVDPSQDALIHTAGEVAALIALGNFDQADSAFRNLLKEYPDTPFAHYAYGSMLASLSRYEEAEKEFREEMKTNSESALPYMQLAFIGLRMNRSRETVPLSEKALKLAPQSFAAHYLLGRALLEVGDVEGSVRELETPRRLGPFSPEVRYAPARAYSKANKKVEASHERAEFTRLNALLEREQRQGGGQSYRSSVDRGRLEPQEISPSANPSPKWPRSGVV